MHTHTHTHTLSSAKTHLIIIVWEKPRANCGLAASKLWLTTKFRKAFYHVTLSTGYKNAFTFCLADSDMRHFAATFSTPVEKKKT